LGGGSAAILLIFLHHRRSIREFPMPPARLLGRPSPRLSVEWLEDRVVPAGDLFISEVHFDPLFGSASQDEFIEIRGEPNAIIPARTYFVTVDGDGPNASGVVHSVFDLGRLTLSPDGYLVIVQGGSNYPINPNATVLRGTTGFAGLPGNRFTDDSTLSDQFEFIFGSNTFMLVQSNIPPVPGTDYDTNDDGVLDGAARNWVVKDSVGVLGTFVGGNAAHHGYGLINFANGGLGNFPAGSTVINTVDFGYVGRVGESTGYAPSDWVAGQTVEFGGANTFNFRFESSIFGHPTIGFLAGRSLDHLGRSNFVASLTGTAFEDLNGDGIRDVSEPGIPGTRINLVPAGSTQGGSVTTVVEPDRFANGTELTNAVPGVTFTEADSQNVQRGRGIVANLNAANASTGTLVFGRGVFWFNDPARLRMDFYNPVQSISIDFKQTSGTGFGRLSVFDANNNLLQTFLSGRVPGGAATTLTITRPTADIAYAVAYSDDTVGSTPFGYLDNLRFTQPAVSTVTQADGSYILNVQDGTFNLIPSRAPGFFLTSPRPNGSYNLTVTNNVGSQNLDFGFTAGRGVFSQVLAVGSVAGLVTAYPPGLVGFDNQTAFNLPLPPEFTGFSSSVRSATGDVNGDGFEDYVVVTGPGTPTRFAVIDGTNPSALLVAPSAPFAGSEGFTGGGFVAVGDIDDDGFAEIVITPDVSGGPRVTIFSVSNGVPVVRANFLGITDANFRGGARAAIGDINGDGRGEVVVAAGQGGGPRISVFDGASIFTARNRLFGDFFVFDQSLRDGVYLGVGDINGDGLGDIVAGAGSGGAPRVLVVSGSTMLASGTLAAVNAPLGSFFTDEGLQGARSGVRIAIKDGDNDGIADVVTGSAEDQPARVRIFSGTSITAGTPTVIQDLEPFNGFPMESGIFVG
jgi:hypothetical protein